MDQARLLALREEKRLWIIAEIRRITAENGDTPPGLEQFARKTGMSRAACLGRIWPRWADALREAGLTPHCANPRLDDEDMLEWFARAARTLGRIPAESDLRVYRASGGSLPGQKAYLRHFGSKQGLLRNMKLWAARSPERSDVAAMLTGIPVEPFPERQLEGAVYLLRCGRAYKIGCSRTPHKRLAELQGILPGDARRVHVIRTDDPYGIESYWHRRFHDKRLRGEWFKLSPEDVAAFRRRKYQ